MKNENFLELYKMVSGENRVQISGLKKHKNDDMSNTNKNKELREFLFLKMGMCHLCSSGGLTLQANFLFFKKKLL